MSTHLLLEAKPRVAVAESVEAGHPDKVADAIADALVDAHLSADSDARVAVEVLVKGDQIIVAGEVDAPVRLDPEPVVRKVVRDLGYTHSDDPFHADTVRITDLLERQSTRPAGDVFRQGNRGAGDQSIVYGYATDETPERLPAALVTAHRLVRELEGLRKAGTLPLLRPDAKSLVRGDWALLSFRLSPDATAADWDEAKDRVRDHLGLPALVLNPGGPFVEGGPAADAGVTGRKLMVDSYGGLARHGGGGFSGKDPTKVDRSAAYFARWVARSIVDRGLAPKAEVRIAYAIGQEEPVAFDVTTLGTGDQLAAEAYLLHFDARPEALIERLGLRVPLYRETTAYGHFGKPHLPWENTHNAPSF